MKSKTFIGKQQKRKLSPDLAETILEAKKNKKWIEVAGLLSGPRRRKIAVNLEEINNIAEATKAKESEKIVIPGKVLGQGELKKKLKIVAYSYSQSAVEKLKAMGADFKTILEEIKSNPDAKGVKILR
jgi:large subunit ribosomal protein L18e